MNFTPNLPFNVLTSRARLGEGPLWDATHQLLYWIDIYNYRVHQFNPSTENDRFFEVGDVVGAIALAGENRLIMAQRDQLAFLNLETGRVQSLLSIETDKPNNRFNDGKCDALGRFWFGSMGSQQGQGQLYRYDPDGSLHEMETELSVSNGLGWSPDQKTFFLTDSLQQKIYAYDFDLPSGKISNRRIFVDLSHESFFPDGLAIDTQGCLWSAMWDGWCIIRFNGDGEEISRLQLPVKRPTCCCFGGQDLSFLYITTASIGLSEAEIEQSFYSGDLFCFPTNTQGLPTHHFSMSF